MSDKEMVIEAVRQLPEHASIKEIAILAAIKKGEHDADAGRVVPHDEMKKRLERNRSRSRS